MREAPRGKLQSHHLDPICPFIRVTRNQLHITLQPSPSTAVATLPCRTSWPPRTGWSRPCMQHACVLCTTTTGEHTHTHTHRERDSRLGLRTRTSSLSPVSTAAYEGDRDEGCRQEKRAFSTRISAVLVVYARPGRWVVLDVPSLCRRSQNKKVLSLSLSHTGAVQCSAVQLSCCQQVGPAAGRPVGGRHRRTQLSACWCLVLVVGIIHTQSPTSQSSPSPRSQIPRLQSQSSPNPPHPAGPATNCQYLYHQPKRQDGHALSHTEARPHSGTQLQVNPGKRSRPLSSQQPDQTNQPTQNQADPDDIPEHCWKRKVVPKKDRQQPVLIADPRTCLLRSPCRLLFFLFSNSTCSLFVLLWVQTGPSIAYPCDRRRQP